MRVAIPITEEAYEALKVHGFDVLHGCTKIPSGGWIINASESTFEKVQTRLHPNESMSDYILRVCRAWH